MVRCSKPEYIPLFEQASDINLTIDIAQKFDCVNINKRSKRRSVNNPNVWYLYIGYEPENCSDYELHELTLDPNGINVTSTNKAKNEKYNRVITTEYFSILNPHDYILFDKVGKTIWVPAPGLSIQGIDNIIQYIRSPFYYENQSYKEIINSIYQQSIRSAISKYKIEAGELFMQINKYKKLLEENTINYAQTISKHDALILMEDSALEKFQQDLDYIKSFSIVKGIEFNNGKITVYMKENIAYNSKGKNPIIVPPVNIVVNLQQGSTPYYYSSPQELYTGYAEKKIFHPHAIYPNENNKIINCCWGNISDTLAKAYSNNEVFELIELLIYFVQQYNEHDTAGAKYINWPKYNG